MNQIPDYDDNPYISGNPFPVQSVTSTDGSPVAGVHKSVYQFTVTYPPNAANANLMGEGAFGILAGTICTGEVISSFLVVLQPFIHAAVPQI